MYLRSDAIQGSFTASALPRVSASLGLVLLAAWGLSTLARSVPDFLRPRTSCYLGAFGPPLEPYVRSAGRDGDAANPPHATAPEASPDWHLSGTTLWTTPNQTPSFQFDIGRADWNGGSNGVESAALGSLPVSGFANQGPMPQVANTSWSDGFVPHWRVAVQRDLERHFLQIGGFGAHAAMFPANFANVADADADYLPAVIVNDPRHGQTTLIRESQPPEPIFAFLRVSGVNKADTAWRTASIDTPAIRYFPALGPTGAGRDLSPANRAPKGGVIAEFAYAPWDEPASPIQFLDLRFAARYGANREFLGIARGVAGGNTLVLSLGGALRF